MLKLSLECGDFMKAYSFLWFPGGIESTCKQDFIIHNDVIANHLEHSCPPWGSLTYGCLSWTGMCSFQSLYLSHFGLAAVWHQNVQIVCVFQGSHWSS